MQTPITRRSALRTGGIAAIVAGLTGSAGTPANAAEAPAAAPATPALIAVLCAEPTPAADAQFKEWVAAWNAERVTVKREYDAIYEQLEAYVPADRQFELVGKLSDLSGDLAALSVSREREIVFRHLPGLEPVLRLLWLHAVTTHLGDEAACGDGFCKDWGYRPVLTRPNTRLTRHQRPRGLPGAAFTLWSYHHAMNDQNDPPDGFERAGTVHHIIPTDSALGKAMREAREMWARDGKPDPADFDFGEPEPVED